MPYKLKKARNKPLYWVVDNTGKKYEKEPIPLERAKKQIVALHISTKHAGGSLWSSVVDIVNNIPGWTTAMVSNKYTRATQKWIDSNKGNTVESVTVRRAPIPDGLTTVFDLITAGQWSPGVKAAGYDKMYHLSILITNQNGKPSQLEKLANLNFTDNIIEEPNTTYKKISIPRGINVGEMLAKTHNAMGTTNYFQYDAFSNNCQTFIYNLLKSNDIGTKADYDWILQPVEELLKREPGFLPGLAKTITNIGSIWGTLFGGGKFPSLNILQKIATQAKSMNPIEVEGWKPVSFTPTMKFYRKDDVIVVSIRGTEKTDLEDLSADASIAVNNLNSSNRYKKDYQAMIDFYYKYKAVPLYYYGVGYSLGGAIMDRLISEGYIKKGVSFNPAIEPSNIVNDSYLKNRRIYIKTDPLYLVMGQFAKGSETVSGKDGKFSHSLSNFDDIVGGLKGRGEKFPTLEKEGPLYVLKYKGRTLSRFVKREDAIAELNTFLSDKNKLKRIIQQIKNITFTPKPKAPGSSLEDELGGGVRYPFFSSNVPRYERLGQDETTQEAILVPIEPDYEARPEPSAPIAYAFPVMIGPEPSAPPCYAEPDIHIGAPNMRDIERRVHENAANRVRRREDFEVESESESDSSSSSDEEDPERVTRSEEEKRYLESKAMTPTDPQGGKKRRHIRKYLKGMGIPATKKNIDKALSACEAEGVVF